MARSEQMGGDASQCSRLVGRLLLRMRDKTQSLQASAGGGRASLLLLVTGLRRLLARSWSTGGHRTLALIDQLVDDEGNHGAMAKALSRIERVQPHSQRGSSRV